MARIFASWTHSTNCSRVYSLWTLPGGKLALKRHSMIFLSSQPSSYGSPLWLASWLCAHVALVMRWQKALLDAGTLVLPCAPGAFDSLGLFPLLPGARWTYCNGIDTWLPATASRWIDLRWTRCFPLLSMSSWRGNCATVNCIQHMAAESQ